MVSPWPCRGSQPLLTRGRACHTHIQRPSVPWVRPGLPQGVPHGVRDTVPRTWAQTARLSRGHSTDRPRGAQGDTQPQAGGEYPILPQLELLVREPGPWGCGGIGSPEGSHQLGPGVGGSSGLLLTSVSLPVRWDRESPQGASRAVLRRGSKHEGPSRPPPAWGPTERPGLPQGSKDKSEILAAD